MIVILLLLGALWTGSSSTEERVVTARAVKPDTVSVEQALARIARHVGVPVGVPEGLPPGTRAGRKVYLSDRQGVPSAQLTLRLPGERASVVILFGAAGFDGCGPLHPRQMSVNGVPGVAADVSDGTGSPYSTVVWPATLPDTDGTYALSGPFTPRKAVALASSMQLDGATDVKPAGC